LLVTSPSSKGSIVSLMPSPFAAVDVVLGGPGIEELFLDRAQHHDFEGTLVPVASPEDLIAMKLLAGRSKDIDDVRTILAANRRTLKLAVVRETLALLEGALGQNDLLPHFEELLRKRG
jgi:hypothetical protein